MCDLSFSSLYVVSLCPSKAVDSSFILFFLSPGDNLKIVVVNKALSSYLKPNSVRSSTFIRAVSQLVRWSAIVYLVPLCHSRLVGSVRVHVIVDLNQSEKCSVSNDWMGCIILIWYKENRVLISMLLDTKVGYWFGSK